VTNKREYASQSDYAEWVREPAEKRAIEVTASLHEAFNNVIRKEEVEVIVFGELTVLELASRLEKHPLVLKPLLLATSIAARAIERDLGIKNLDTYGAHISHEQGLAIAGYIKPFLPESLPLPSLVQLDRVMFSDKEVRKIKGQWENMVIQSLNSYSKLLFKKAKFDYHGQKFEIDAAAKDTSGRIVCAVDIKRIEAKRDIHKRSDEIINKGTHLKTVYPNASFGVVIYYPFTSEHGNLRDRLQSSSIDSIVFAASSRESVDDAVKLLLGKFKCLK
jgi:hypothetical protein